MACTSVVMWGTNWAASTITTAPAAWARSASARTGLSVPSTFDAAVNENALAPSRSSSRFDRSSRPSSVRPTYRSSIPSCSLSMSQGTMLAWCSIWVSTTASPARRLARPHDCATRFIDSVTFLENRISRSEGALTNRPMRARALS